MIVSKSFVKFNHIDDMNDLKPSSYIKLKGKRGGILAVLPNDELKGQKIEVDKEDVFGKEIEVNPMHELQILPNIRGKYQKNIRDIHYLIGRSGSGKTHWAGVFAKEYKSLFPKRKIIYISPQKLEKDDLLLQLNPLLAQCAGDEAERNWIDPETKFEIPGGEDKNGKQIKSPFDKSLVIIDDLEGVTNKKVKNSLDSFISSILHTGRHRSISVIFLKHRPCTGRDTASILNESHYITIFPRGNEGTKIDYLMKTYVGLNKEQLLYVKSLKSRAVTMHLNVPSFVLTDRELKIF